jgi:alpha-1,2-mannosyltransferase
MRTLPALVGASRRAVVVRLVLRVVVRVAVVCAISVAGWIVTHHVAKPPWHHFFDLRVYHGAVDWWLAGQPLYSFLLPRTRYGFTYPPFAAVVMTPLAAVSEPVAGVLSTVASAVVLGVTTWWLVAPVARRAGWSPWYAVGIALPVIVVSDPVRETIGFGQVNLFIVALVVADVVALRRGGRWAGLGIGLAAAVKLTPAVFVLYLLLTRRWRAAGVAVGAFVAATAVAVAVAPRTSLQFWTQTVWETARVGRLDKTSNQSLLGMLARLADPGVPSRLLWAVLAGGVLIVAMRRAVRAYRQGDELVGITLTGLAGCLVSPISWTHHLYWVVPAAVVLVDVAAGARLSDTTPWWVRARGRVVARSAAAAVWAMIVVFWSGLIWYVEPANGVHHRQDLWGLLGEDTYGLLMIALLVLLPVRAPAPEPARPIRREAPALATD